MIVPQTVPLRQQLGKYLKGQPGEREEHWEMKTELRIEGHEEEEEMEVDQEGVEDEEEEKQGEQHEREGLEDAEQEGVGGGEVGEYKRKRRGG